jgi:hypothetical protein
MDHRTAKDRKQDFGEIALHASPFAGSQDDCGQWGHIFPLSGKAKKYDRKPDNILPEVRRIDQSGSRFVRRPTLRNLTKIPGSDTVLSPPLALRGGRYSATKLTNSPIWNAVMGIERTRELRRRRHRKVKLTNLKRRAEKASKSEKAVIAHKVRRLSPGAEQLITAWKLA